MADTFISKIRVAPGDFVTAGDRPVLERFEALRALLEDRAGPEVAALFAEPLISKGNDTAPPSVSWYTALPGEARPFAQLSPAERDRAERYLSDHLRPLRALAEDPATGDLALGALTTYGQDDIVLIGERPVIVNWGLLPEGGGANAGARADHYAATLGRFLPLAGAQAAPVSATPPPAPVTPSRASVAAASTGAVPVAAAVADRRGPARLSAIAWVPLLVLLVLAGGVLAWLLMPGTRLFHADVPPQVTDDAMLAAARARNESLRDRKAALEAALSGAVCRADGQLILPSGLTPEGLTPPPVGVAPERKAQAAPDALLPNAPDRVLVPGPGTEENTLLALIEARTVLVLAAGTGGQGATGSGFMVGPGLVVTNHHVIEPAMNSGGQILVTGDALAAPQQARVLKTLGPLMEAGGDFALLQIDDTSAPAFTVHMPSASLKLTNVVAAGFPGDVLEIDVSFSRLKAGDLSAVPELTVTDGTINTEQRIGPQTHVLMHSAALSSGNSGGPLVDMCGRLVGVNSFVRQGRMQNRGFALTSGDLMAFLNGTTAAPAVVSEACAPLVVRPQVTPAPVPAAEKPASE